MFLLSLGALLGLVSSLTVRTAVAEPKQIETSYATTFSTTTTYTSTSSSFTSTVTLITVNATTVTSYTATVTSAATSLVVVTVTTSAIATSTATSVSTTSVANLPPNPCPVAVAVAGTALEPYANSLRGFRNAQIMKTSSGQAFMTVFDGWYYGWAPAVARTAAANHMFAEVLRFGLVPLFGILYASYYSYLAVAPIDPEAGAIVAGTVAASLIGLVYVAPSAHLSMRVLRLRKIPLRFPKVHAMLFVAWVVGSGLLIGRAYLAGSFALMGLATASLTVSMVTFGSIVGVRAISSIKPSTVNPTLILNMKRLKHELV
jgi:hypothetical protein